MSGAGPMKGIFVTGTDTGIGKTLVASTLLHVIADQGRKVVGLKPVASGAEMTAEGLRNADALALAAQSSVKLPYELTNPFCFEPAIAPHLAAAEAGTPIRIDDLVQWYELASKDADLTVLEGAGGWRVPLYPDGFLSDLPERLGQGVILVVGLRLGCLNHARLTREAIEGAGRSRLLGWVGNSLPEPLARLRENLDALSTLLGGPPIALLPSLPAAEPAAAARWFDYAELQRRLEPTAV